MPRAHKLVAQAVEAVPCQCVPQRSFDGISAVGSDIRSTQRAPARPVCSRVRLAIALCAFQSQQMAGMRGLRAPLAEAEGLTG